jgi:predicted nucleotidyltransferase
MLYRLKSNESSEQDLVDEIGFLINELKNMALDEIRQVYIFGSASLGVSAMHQYSDIDLCIIVGDKFDLKKFRRKVPVSRKIPVDWIIVHETEFAEKSRANSGIYAVIAREGKSLWKAGATPG